jgi:hypothetical protein
MSIMSSQNIQNILNILQVPLARDCEGRPIFFGTVLASRQTPSHPQWQVDHLEGDILVMKPPSNYLSEKTLECYLLIRDLSELRLHRDSLPKCSWIVYPTSVDEFVEHASDEILASLAEI